MHFFAGSAADKVVVLVGVVPGALAVALEEVRGLAAERANGSAWTMCASERRGAGRGGAGR